MIRAKYYYESHVTLKPVFSYELERLKLIAEMYDFRVAELLLKREDGTEELSQKDSFCSAKSENLEDICNRTKLFVQKLNHEFEVIRYKIEDTLLDSRINDEWQLL